MINIGVIFEGIGDRLWVETRSDGDQLPSAEEEDDVLRSIVSEHGFDMSGVHDRDEPKRRRYGYSRFHAFRTRLPSATRRLTISITIETSGREHKIPRILRGFPDMLDGILDAFSDGEVLSARGFIHDGHDHVAEYSFHGASDNEDPAREVQIADQDHLVRLGYKL